MRTLMLFIAAGILFMLAACAPTTGPAEANRAADLAFLPEKPAKGHLFAMYNHHGKVVRRNNWTARFDLTGVAWNDPRTATAISRQHVVMAAHYVRPTTVPVIFHDRSGNKHQRKLTHVMPVNGADIAVGLLDQALPAGVKHYRFAGPEDAAPMRLVLVTDQTMTLSLHRLGGIQAGRVVLGNDPLIPKTYWRKLVSGDSGNPAFIERGGELLLLTTFSTGGSGSGPFYGDPAIRQALSHAVARLPQP